MLNQTHQLAPATLKDLLSKVRFPILDSNQMGETAETEWKRWLKTFDTNTVVTPGDLFFFYVEKIYVCILQIWGLCREIMSRRQCDFGFQACFFLPLFLHVEIIELDTQ